MVDAYQASQRGERAAGGAVRKRRRRRPRRQPGSGNVEAGSKE